MEAVFGFAQPSGPAIDGVSKNDASTQSTTTYQSSVTFADGSTSESGCERDGEKLSLFGRQNWACGGEVIRLCGALYVGYVITSTPMRNCTQKKLMTSRNHHHHQETALPD